MKALVFGVEKWLGIARIPKSLRDVGFAVGILSTPDTFLWATRHAEEKFPLKVVDGPHLLSALSRAVDEWGAEIIVPGDESVLSMLHQIVSAAERGFPTGLSEAVHGVVARSLPPSRFFEATTKKNAFANLCRELRIRVPDRVPAHNMADLLGYAERNGYPVVVRTDESIAGQGVHVCEDEDALVRAGYSTLPQFAGMGSDLPAQPVAVEPFVKGAIAHIATVSWEGKILASATAIKHRCHPPLTGPSTVLKFVEVPEAEEFAGVFLSHTRVPGYCMFDFMLDEESGRCTFLECNARTVAASTASLHAGVDLAAAFLAALTGKRQPRFFLKEGAMVALYPQEVVRDPHSEFLTSAIHDVPEDDPDLVAAYEEYIAERAGR